MSLEEIFYWLARKPNARLSAWFDAFLPARCQVVPITPEIAKRCGQLRGQLAARGSVRAQTDMLIAATAQLHQLTVVTRNVRDFQDCAVPLLNPFS